MSEHSRKMGSQLTLSAFSKGRISIGRVKGILDLRMVLVVWKLRGECVSLLGYKKMRLAGVTLITSCTSTFLSQYSVSVSLSLSLPLPLYLSTLFLSLSLSLSSVPLLIYLIPLSLSLCLSVSPYPCVSVSLCLCISPSLGNSWKLVGHHRKVTLTIAWL